MCVGGTQTFSLQCKLYSVALLHSMSYNCNLASVWVVIWHLSHTSWWLRQLESACNAEEGNGYSLQYSCPENPMGRES